MCMFPACCFHQRTYMAQGLVNGVFNETWTLSCLQLLKSLLFHQTSITILTTFFMNSGKRLILPKHSMLPFIINSSKHKVYRGCPHGVMVKAMDCGIVVREFVLQSRYYVHFRANTLGKGKNPFILPAMG